MRRLLVAALWTFLTLAPLGAGAQGLPRDDEIVLPGRAATAPASPPPPRAEPPTRASRPARSARAERRRHGRRGARAARAEEPAEPTDEDEDAEAARLEEEGIEYEVRQEMEWEERRRREHEEAPPEPERRSSRGDLEPAVEDGERPGDRDADADRVSDRELERELDREVERDMEREERERDRDRHEERGDRPRREPLDLVRLEVGLAASTRSQDVDTPDGSTIHYAQTPFASAFGSVVLTPLARLDGGPRGLGLALSYDRAIRMEAVFDDQTLEASADHLSAMALYRFILPGRVRLEPRLGYDLARFLLAPNDTLPGIVYESIAIGGQVQVPILRDRRTGDDRVRVRIGGYLYFPIGLGEAAARYGQAGSASGVSFEGGVEGSVSGLFGYFALIRHSSYSATFHAPESAGETESGDGITTGLCGGSVKF